MGVRPSNKVCGINFIECVDQDMRSTLSQGSRKDAITYKILKRVGETTSHKHGVKNESDAKFSSLVSITQQPLPQMVKAKST
jgi:hypothetical protein